MDGSLGVGRPKPIERLSPWVGILPCPLLGRLLEPVMNQSLGTWMLVPSLLAASTAFAQPLELPFRGNDLKWGERFDTDTHAKTGEQDEGKDIVVSRHIGGNQWSRMKEGKTDDTVNANHLAYGKPVYAMAAGKVTACWRNAEENRPPGLHAKYKLGRIPGNGNHVVLLQDDGRYAHYAHLRPGTVSSSICPNAAQYVSSLRDDKGQYVRDEKTGYIYPDPAATQVSNGVRVAAGQKLGEIGNSGSSSGPHLHLHVQEADGKPSVMRFARGMTTPYPGRVASLDGPWKRLQGGPLPNGQILIWPPRPAVKTASNGVDHTAFQRTYEHFIDSGLMPDTIACRNGGDTYDSTWVPTQGNFIVHYRMLVQDFASKKSTYSAEGWRLVSQSKCGLIFAAIWRK